MSNVPIRLFNMDFSCIVRSIACLCSRLYVFRHPIRPESSAFGAR